MLTADNLASMMKEVKEGREKHVNSLVDAFNGGMAIIPNDNLSGVMQVLQVSPEMYEKMYEKLKQKTETR